MILNKINISYKIFCFNSSLNLIYSNLDSKGDVNFLLFPNYDEPKCLISKLSYIIKFQFMKDNLFFIFKLFGLSLYIIQNDEAKLLNSNLEIKFEDKSSCEVIDLNTEFYYLVNKQSIYILKKNNLQIAKTLTLNLDDYNYVFLPFLQFVNKFATVFVRSKDDKRVYYLNYQILNDGFEWKLITNKLIIKDKIISLSKYKKQILLIGENYCYLVEQYGKISFYNFMVDNDIFGYRGIYGGLNYK